MSDNNLNESIVQENSSKKQLNCHSLSKLQLDDHIKAYLNKQHLERENQIIPCENEMVEKVVTNYVIAKQILSNLSWQERMLYQHVCSTWHSAIKALKKEQLNPSDFMIHFSNSGGKVLFKLKQSSNFHSEPLVVFIFMNISAASKFTKCQNITPSPCFTPCEKEHLAVDVIQKFSCAPKDCMLAAKAHCVSYMPLPTAKTKDGTITRLSSQAFIGGLYLPVIPNVQFHKINLKTNSTMQQEFYTAIDNIVIDQVIKGVLVFVTDKHLLQSVEDIVFLNHIKDVQPDIPYALGGCICEDTLCDSDDISHIVNSTTPSEAVSDNLISIGIFTVPKAPEKNECNFNMFSVILESSEWDKAKIQSSIKQFAKDVPQYEHSACLRLSCIGRDRRHKFEQDCFRAAFPSTCLTGCYGNGELGVNHPEKPTPEWPKNIKRTRMDSGPQFGIIYSYSTVFVYMGWGKVTTKVDK
ncbi:unnamed protein product [Colias eurytheme]|nr:unnamed protein product [Colias eurytheme]